MNISVLFIIAYGITTSIFLLLFNNSNHKRYVLFMSSTIFYIYIDPKYYLLLLSSIIYSFFLCKIQKNKPSKLGLFLATIPLILILFYFKYKHILFNLNTLYIPLGLSYYSFKIISYCIDTYNNKSNLEIQFIDYYNYITFFPQILCGPISRVDTLGLQLKNLVSPSRNQLNLSIYLILSGLFKKIVIADRITSYVNSIFNSPYSYPALSLWLAAFLFTIQIYCDFAGYSEIAIGISLLMGIDVQPNFLFPYFSYSISEFWKRWHISLSTWLKDYIYIPLGGSRKGHIRTCINLLITFLVSGMWHGSGITFIIWGLFHGIISMIPIKKAKNFFSKSIQIMITFVLISFSWIIFNSKSLTHLINYVKIMFVDFNLSTTNIINSILPFTNDYTCLSYLLVVIIQISILAIFELNDIRFFSNHGYSTHKYPPISYYRIFVFICFIIFFGTWGQNSFIYAQF